MRSWKRLGRDVKDLQTRVSEISGEVLAAAVVSSKAQDVESAIETARTNPTGIKQWASNPSQYTGIGRFEMPTVIRNLDQASSALAAIRIDVAHDLENARQSTAPDFEDHLVEAKKAILYERWGKSGVIPGIDEMLTSAAGDASIPREAYKLLADAKVASAGVDKKIKLMLSPLRYRLTDRRLIFAAVVVVIVSIPVVYLVRHSGSPKEAYAAVANNVEVIQQRAIEHGPNTIDRSVAVLKGIWEFVPDVSKVITLIAAALAFIRKVLVSSGSRDRALGRWQEAFEQLGKAIKE
jgi:hypothetical protein